DGRWVKRIRLPQGEYVNCVARFRASSVETPARSVVATLVWVDEGGKELSNPEFAITTAAPDAQGWRTINEIYKVPAKAKQAQIELRLRWTPKGEVEWRDAEVKTAHAPAPRMVKVASVNHRPRA